MVALAAAFVGASVMAANVDWAVDCYDLSTDVSGWTIYAINGDATGVFNDLMNKGYANASEFYTALGKMTKVEKELDGDAFAKATNTGLSKTGDALSFLIIDSDADGADIFYTGALSTDGYTWEGTESPKSFAKYDDSFTAGTIAYGSAVPEPTSGLLLLLGVAGLALRRRRA